MTWHKIKAGHYICDRVDAEITRRGSTWEVYIPNYRANYCRAWASRSTLAEAKAAAMIGEMDERKAAKRARKQKGQRIARALATGTAWSPELGITELEFWSMRHHVHPKLFTYDAAEDVLRSAAAELINQIAELSLSKFQRRQISAAMNEVRAAVDWLDDAEESLRDVSARAMPDWLLEEAAT